jgi:DNA-directed RNA polymerase specialized sigma24 family protein
MAIEMYMEFPKRRPAAQAMDIPIATLWHRERSALKSLRKKLRRHRRQ